MKPLRSPRLRTCKGSGSVLQRLPAPVWAEGPGEVRLLEDLMLGGREEVGGGGMCRDLSWGRGGFWKYPQTVLP